MIITLFVTFLILSIILIFLGKYAEAPPVSLAGFLFIFIIGVATLISGLGYEAGTSYNYVCACCENGIYTEGYTTGLGFCYGTPNPCDYYDLNELDCIASGCTYNATDLSCYGTPSDCDTFMIQRTCDLVGCTYQSGTSTTCPNGTSQVTTSEVHTPIQEAFSDTMSHMMGIWISLIAVFGFAIKLGQIRAGFKNE